MPLRHATTSSPEEAAALYAQHALVLNVPLNHGPGHRFFEVMAAGVPHESDRSSEPCRDP